MGKLQQKLPIIVIIVISLFVLLALFVRLKSIIEQRYFDKWQNRLASKNKPTKESEEIAQKILQASLKKYQEMNEYNATGQIKFSYFGKEAETIKFNLNYTRNNKFVLEWEYFENEERAQEESLKEKGQLLQTGAGKTTVTTSMTKYGKGTEKSVDRIRDGLHEAESGKAFSYEIPRNLIGENTYSQLSPPYKSVEMDCIERFENVECYVITALLLKTDDRDGMFVSAWIGKNDLLIRKVDTIHITKDGTSIISEIHKIVRAN